MDILRAFQLARHPKEFRQRLARKVRSRLHSRRVDQALRNARGVIHIGANTGQERDIYDRHDLAVLWVEPIPTVFATLTQNTASFPKQRCLNALVADTDGREFTLNIASNDGASSSILELADHRDIWPDIHYVDAIRLHSITLPTLLRSAGLVAEQYDILTLDTQGSELLILKGAAPLLREFAFIRAEAADFESYVGCAKRHEITDFLDGYGFKEWVVEAFAGTESRSGGNYYDILYRNVSM